MTEDQLRSYGVLLLRVALGVMFLAHSIVYMLLTLTLPETAKFFVSIGLPAWLAYATFLAEVARWNPSYFGYPNAAGSAGAFADSNRCDLGSRRKRLALCLRERRMGVPPLPVRSLHCASHAWRRRVRACSVALARWRCKPATNCCAAIAAAQRSG
jgi:hypothetical protein